VRLAEVAIPERMADAVAAFDPNCRAMRTVVLALTLGLAVDATSADRSGLAVRLCSQRFAPRLSTSGLSVAVRRGSKSRWEVIWRAR
jgi:hypothetical protein